MGREKTRTFEPYDFAHKGISMLTMDDHNGVLVIGAGVTGLTTALCARRRGYKVTVVADRFAPDITSVIAGALWEWPPAVCGQHRDQESLDKSKYWAADSYEIFTKLADDPATGVHVRPATFYFRNPVESMPDALAKMTEIREHVRGFRHDTDLITENGVDPGADAVDAYSHLAPMIDTDQYMKWLLDQVRSAGCQVSSGSIRGRLVEQQSELMARYNVGAIVNCSGLGSIELADEDMQPLRGALIHAYNGTPRRPTGHGGALYGIRRSARQPKHGLRRATRT